MIQQLYTFDGLDEMYETATEIPDVERFDVYAHRPSDDEDSSDSGDWERLPYRSSLWLEDNAVGDVSSPPTTTTSTSAAISWRQWFADGFESMWIGCRNEAVKGDLGTMLAATEVPADHVHVWLPQDLQTASLDGL